MSLRSLSGRDGFVDGEAQCAPLSEWYSFVVMRMYGLCLATLVSLIFACSSSQRIGDPGDGGPFGDSDTDGGSWNDASHWWPDADPQDVGPVCPDSGGAVLTDYQCDIFEQDCPSGLACYGWIEYVDGYCAREVYHRECLMPGTGGQGDPCDYWCRAGFECFVTGEGTQCLAVCDILGGRRTCPPGYICQPTDLPGIGACH